MFEYLSYVLSFGILIIILIYFYIHVKYGFWVSQPVFHKYDVSYMFHPPGIIQHSLPEKNKYTNFKDIDTIVFSQLSSIQKTRFVNLIKLNYLQNKDIMFSPTTENILPYFIGNNDKSFVSFFYKDTHMIDLKKGTMITDRQIVGSITSRPLNVIINNDSQKQPVEIRVYYMDYLCVDKLNNSKEITPQLIQTHDYNQRHINENIVISVFKREDELSGIVPLCIYSIYGFPVYNWTKPPELTGQYNLLEINGTNYRLVYDFIHMNSSKFDIIIKPDMANILELIKTKNIFVYAILCDGKILCCYFFRKSCVQIEKGLEALICFASICHCEEDIFIQGFKISFWKIAAENFFGFALLENISHNNILINNIMLKTTPSKICKTSYFFYNFAYPTFHSEKVLIIN
jgi:hypothetical protein